MVFDKVPALAPALAPGALLRPGRMCSLAEDPAPFTPLRPRPLPQGHFRARTAVLTHRKFRPRPVPLGT